MIGWGDVSEGMGTLITFSEVWLCWAEFGVLTTTNESFEGVRPGVVVAELVSPVSTKSCASSSAILASDLDNCGDSSVCKIE